VLCFGAFPFIQMVVWEVGVLGPAVVIVLIAWYS